MIANEIETTTRIWYGCYDGGWQNLIQPESMAHPAKFSRNLISRIYSYALERGWLKVGDTVLDCFGGVGLGALDAGANGLNYIGVELETRFHDMGQGCDCTGISPEEWRGYKHLFESDKIGQLNYKYGRHWCPSCIAGATQINSNGLNDHRQPGLFDTAEDSCLPTGFRLAEDGTPYSLPHHYTGNLELFRKYAQPGTWAVLLNGDSRNLQAVIGQAVADGLLSSPPYVNSVNQSAQANDTEARIKRMRQAGIDVTNRANVGGANGVARQPQNYGESTGQLGGMSEGSLADSLVSSPPYANGEKGHPSLGSVNKDNWGKDGRDIAGRRGLDGNYGGTDGQLANMPLGDAVLSSPPFAGNTGGRGEASRNGIDAALFDRHSGGMKRGTGDNPANLDHLPMKGLTDALLSSPPFMDNNVNIGAVGNTPGMRQQIHDSQKRDNSYGTTPGQLGTEQGTTFWAAAKQIVSESYLALKPGAFTFWVVKRFVRDGAIVDFTYQWRQLCEACGFEFVEHIEASLIQSESKQSDLNGDVIKTKKKRASFFRRLHEKKFPHLAIDCEDILVMRKPL